MILIEFMKLFKNTTLKLVSIFAAFLLWFHVTTNIKTVVISVPYEIKGVPENRIVLAQPKDKIEVRISGPSFLLDNIQSSYPVFKVFVPLGLNENTYTATLSADSLMLPSAVNVISVEPYQLEIKLDDLATKLVPVEVPRIGVVNQDFRLKGVEVTPSHINCSGPKSKLTEIEQIETYPLNLKNLDHSIEQIIGIRKPDGRFDVRQDVVKVKVLVEEVIADKIVKNVPIVLDFGNSDIQDKITTSVIPDKINLRLHGPLWLLKQLDTKRLIIPLKLEDEVIAIEQTLSEKTSFQKEFQLEYSPPKNIELLRIIPSKVLINFKN
jgi:YbbR domain-containing protein